MVKHFILAYQTNLMRLIFTEINFGVNQFLLKFLWRYFLAGFQF